MDGCVKVCEFVRERAWSFSCVNLFQLRETARGIVANLT